MSGKSQIEIDLLEEIKRLHAEIEDRKKLLAQAQRDEQEARGRRLSLGACENCRKRPATGHYGVTLTCDPCNDRLNREFDEDYS